MSKYRFTRRRVLSTVRPFLPIAIALSRGSTSTTTLFLSGRSVTRISFNRAGARLFLIRASGVSAYSTTSICRLVIRRSMLMFFPPLPMARPISPGFATKMILSSFSSIIQSWVVAPVMLSKRAMYFISSLVSLILGWSITFSQRPVSRPPSRPPRGHQRGHREGFLADRPEIQTGPREDVDWNLRLFSVVKNILPVRLLTVTCEYDQLRPGRRGARQRVLRAEPNLAGFDRPPYLLVHVNHGLFRCPARHRHGDLDQSRSHGDLLSDYHVLGHAAQRVRDPLHRRIHYGRDSNLKRRLGQSARLLPAHSVSSDLENIPRRGHHVRHKHDMPHVNVQPLLLEHL